MGRAPQPRMAAPISKKLNFEIYLCLVSFIHGVNCNLKIVEQHSRQYLVSSAHMPTIVDIQTDVEKIDQQIIELLAQRAQLCADAGGMDADAESDTLSLWLDAAAEHDLDEGKMDRIAKLVVMLCRKTEEE